MRRGEKQATIIAENLAAKERALSASIRLREILDQDLTFARSRIAQLEKAVEKARSFLVAVEHSELPELAKYLARECLSAVDEMLGRSSPGSSQ